MNFPTEQLLLIGFGFFFRPDLDISDFGFMHFYPEIWEEIALHQQGANDDYSSFSETVNSGLVQFEIT